MIVRNYVNLQFQEQAIWKTQQLQLKLHLSRSWNLSQTSKQEFSSKLMVFVINSFHHCTWIFSMQAFLFKWTTITVPTLPPPRPRFFCSVPLSFCPIYMNYHPKEWKTRLWDLSRARYIAWSYSRVICKEARLYSYPYNNSSQVK